ncbi:MAG TPA: trehalose-phosphatase, partial [Anaerolineales bacterium]|nr:trehalose-phosphatase [Anaerolineales bacterium]
FAPTPDHIEPNPGIVRVIEQLARGPTIRVTILTGRRLGHIRQLMPLSGIFLAGTYGIELLTPTDETIHRVQYDDIRPVLEAIKPQWEQMIYGRSGFFLEDKGWTLALHARFAEAEEAQQILSQAQQCADTNLFTESFRILGGHQFLEIAPLLASKGGTVSFLLSEYPLADARLLCIGDDDKDEEAFSVIHARGGTAVKVIQPSQALRPTQADFFFESPLETLQWLEELISQAFR